jgi:hypothetical protein
MYAMLSLVIESIIYSYLSHKNKKINDKFDKKWKKAFKECYLRKKYNLKKDEKIYYINNKIYYQSLLLQEFGRKGRKIQMKYKKYYYEMHY